MVDGNTVGHAIRLDIMLHVLREYASEVGQVIADRRIACWKMNRWFYKRCWISFHVQYEHATEKLIVAKPGYLVSHRLRRNKGLFEIY